MKKIQRNFDALPYCHNNLQQYFSKSNALGVE